MTSIPPAATPQIQKNCEIPFIQHNWQFVHAIQTTMMGGSNGMMIGVTDISPERRRIHCVMMTIEGLVMLDAMESDGNVVINRGIPPFDSMNFVRGLMDDIRLMFFIPARIPDRIGTLKDGEPVCRYPAGPDRTVDVIIRSDIGWSLRLYHEQRLVRTVNARAPSAGGSPWPDPIPDHIELIAHDGLQYHLNLTLLEAIPLQDE